jgi:outer membrane protein assembly factor BamB
LAAATAGAASAPDWNHYRGPDYNGISKETGWTDHWPAEGPRQLWKASIGTGFSSVSVSQDRVFAIGNEHSQDVVRCLDAATGREVWKQSYESPADPLYYEGGPSATPTVAGGRVFTFSKKGVANCYTAADGKLVWSTNLATGLGLKAPMWGFAGSPCVQGNRVVLNAGAAGVCLDAATGEPIWKSDTSASGYSTPVPFEYGGKKCVILFEAQTVSAVTVDKGEVVWSYPWKTLYDVNAADPVPFSNKVFVTSGYERGCAVFEVNGGETRKIWENKNIRGHFTSPVLLDGFIYGIDGGAGNDAQLKCLDAATGETKWSVDKVGTGGLFAAAGKLVVLGAAGELMAGDLSPKSFAPASRAQVLGGKCWTVPVLSGGRIYARNAKGDLVCLDVKG